MTIATSTDPPNVDDVVNALGGRRYHYRDELTLQDGLSAPLNDAGIPHQREVPVTGGRIDFVVGVVGIEVKVKGSTSSVDAQLTRYARSSELQVLLLVTTRPAHRAVTATNRDLPVRVLLIGGLSL